MAQVAIAAALCGALTLQQAGAAAAPSTTGDAIARGKYLVELGGCQSCHSAPHGAPFAGGLSMDTPYGPIVTPNITPDKATGIGSWTDDQFYQALHDGIDNHGKYIYPVMPFPYYTKLTRSDVDAMRRFMATIPAVHNVPPPSGLHFPFSVRESLLAWRVAFFKAGEYQADTKLSDDANRGAYLVEGLAHCGECHNARPVAGQSKFDKAFQGGVIDNWYAPNITNDARAGIGAWSDVQLVSYLKTGMTPNKGIALGPMAETVENLSHATPEDLQAMVAYLRTTKAVSEPEQQLALYKGRDARGSDIYLNNCASCHGIEGKGVADVIPSLVGNGAVTAKGPENVIEAVVGGAAATGNYAPMPAVGANLSDEDIASVTNFVRQLGSNAEPAPAEAGMVAKIRKEAQTLMNGAPDSTCPDIGDAKLEKALNGAGIATSLKGIDDAQMLEAARSAVRKTRGALPGVKQADLVNSVSATYCSVLKQDASISAADRAIRIGQFSELVYTEANGHGYHPK